MKDELRKKLSRTSWGRKAMLLIKELEEKQKLSISDLVEDYKEESSNLLNIIHQLTTMDIIYQEKGYIRLKQ